MFEDMLAWDNASEDGHADTVLRLVAAVTAALDLADRWDRAAGPDSRAWSVFGPQKVSVPFATKSIRAVIEAALTEEES